MTVKLERLNHVIEVEDDEVERYAELGWRVATETETKKVKKNGNTKNAK